MMLLLEVSLVLLQLLNFVISKLIFKEINNIEWLLKLLLEFSQLPLFLLELLSKARYHIAIILILMLLLLLL